jgi:hypothetical protein
MTEAAIVILAISFVIVVLEFIIGIPLDNEDWD